MHGEQTLHAPVAIIWHDLPDDERSSVTVNDQDPYSQDSLDSDPDETSEWQESLQQLVQAKGHGRGREIMLSLLQTSHELQLNVPQVPTTDYINTIAPDNEPEFPGDEELERRYRRWLRWNAAITVHNAPSISLPSRTITRCRVKRPHGRHRPQPSRLLGEGL